MYKIYSTAFLEQDVEHYSCYVDEELWRKITNDLNDNRIFVQVKNSNKYWICSLGHPIRNSFDTTNHIYVPKWMLEQISLDGVGEECDVELFPSNAFDTSLKITLQPHSIESQVETIQEILSNELTKLAILQKNTTIQIVMPGVLNNAKFEVVDLEPASIVLCEGDEVLLDFLPSLDSIEDIVPNIEATPTAPVVEDSVPETPTLGGVKREGRFNPWRNKDFKPSTS